MPAQTADGRQPTVACKRGSLEEGGDGICDLCRLGRRRAAVVCAHRQAGGQQAKHQEGLQRLEGESRVSRGVSQSVLMSSGEQAGSTPTTQRKPAAAAVSTCAEAWYLTSFATGSGRKYLTWA